MGAVLAVALLAGFIAPLVVTQEIGYWRSPRFVSNLVWDEGQAVPGQQAPPQPADARLATAHLLAGIACATGLVAVVLALRAWARPAERRGR